MYRVPYCYSGISLAQKKEGLKSGKVNARECDHGLKMRWLSLLFFLLFFFLTHGKNKDEWKSRIIYQVCLFKRWKIERIDMETTDA